MAIRRPTFTFIAGLTVGVILFTAGRAPAAQDEPTVVVLHVDNYALVPHEHLEQTEREVTRIYRAAGIEMIWIEGNGPADPSSRESGAGPAAVHLRVLLLCQDMAARKIERDGIPPNVLGRAAGPTARAYILTHRVRELAARHRTDFDRLLGRVIAHEIGHLLLPPHSHSASGIMRETLDTSTSAAVFTATQRKLMRSSLQSRN